MAMCRARYGCSFFVFSFFVDMFSSLVTLLIVVYVTYRLLKYFLLDPWSIHRDLWSQGIPGRYVPVLGELLEIRRANLAGDPFSHERALTKKFGCYYHTSFGPTARLVITDPSLIQGVLKSNARSYHKSNLMRLILGTLLGCDNLLMSEDHVHSQHRRLIAPLFQQQNLHSMIELMAQITENLLQQWKSAMKKKKEGSLRLDIQGEMARLTLDIVTGCVFGSGLMKDETVRNLIYNNVTTTLQDVEKRMFNMIALVPILNQLPLASKRRIDKSKFDVKVVIQRIIEERKKGLTKSACKGPDLLDLILTAHGDDKTSQFTDEEIFQEALTFVIAGHETTSNLMIWTLLNLTKNPDVYHRLEKEIDSVFTDDEEITVAHLSLLTYTEAVLKESLRLDQPVPAIVRKAIEDNTLVASDGKAIRVKKGADVMIDIYGLHHSETLWSDPYQFDPSRFDQRHKEIYLPFSAGPRSCIGQSFAMLEAKIMLAMLVKRFHFQLVPAQKHTPEIIITMRPKYGMWMDVTLREN